VINAVLSIAVHLSAAVQFGRERNFVYCRGEQESDQSVWLYSPVAGSSTAATSAAWYQLFATGKRFTVKCRHQVLMSQRTCCCKKLWCLLNCAIASIQN